MREIESLEARRDARETGRHFVEVVVREIQLFENGSAVMMIARLAGPCGRHSEVADVADLDPVAPSFQMVDIDPAVFRISAGKKRQDIGWQRALGCTGGRGVRSLVHVTIQCKVHL